MKVKLIDQRESTRQSCSGLDLSTPIGKAMLTMFAAVAALERSNIKLRQMAGIAKTKAEGKALGREEAITMLPLRAGEKRIQLASS
ncbi:MULTISPECIES: recombinase family protein [Aeromonas]|uniref:recombinase family protein n=1 Tax=Aeromonas TaxID=642 RepID=UPI0020B1F880|nr:recombinase family protein [Aeromonas sp. FDAARGOS 1414]